MPMEKKRFSNQFDADDDRAASGSEAAGIAPETELRKWTHQ